MVYRIKANHEIIRQYRCAVLIYFDWLIGCDWLVGWVGHKMCDLQTELETAENA